MSHFPSRMSSSELNLDHAPLAGRASSGPAFAGSSPKEPASPVNPAPPRRPRRRTGFSIGRVVLFVAILAAVAGGAWWFAGGRGGKESRTPDGEVAGGGSGEDRSSGGLSVVPDEIRPVIEYLRPSDAEVLLWLESVLASSYVREKWGSLAESMSLAYDPTDDAVNAFAFYDKEKAGRPSIALCGGWVRLARLVGALELVRSSAEAQGVEKDIKAYLRRVSGIVAETGELSEENVIDLLDEFGVRIAVFQDVGAVSSAKAIADGVCKATLAHEFGHLTAGHPRGADLNTTVSQNEERQADLFASSIAASVANGQQMLKGQIWTWYTLALAENINPTNEIFRSHPYSADRLRSAFDANKSLAASLNITSGDVDKLVADATARMNDEQSEKSLEVAKTALPGKARTPFDPNDPIVKKAVDSYLNPDKGYLEQLLVAVKGSEHVRNKYSDIAATTKFDYIPDNNSVNAEANSDGRILLYGGMVRVARTMGAVFAFGTSGKDPDAFVRELGARIRDRGGFTKEDVKLFLDRYEVDFGKFTSRPDCSNAEIIADAIVKATLAHEFGHLAMGHCKGRDVNNGISQLEEKEADRFASKIAASDPHGKEYFAGQVFSMTILAFAEKERAFSTHPKAMERLIDVIRDNKDWAKAAKITEDDVRKYFEENAPKSPTAPLPGESGEDKKSLSSEAGARDGEGRIASIILPGGRKTLRAGSVAEAKKELSAIGKSLTDDYTKTVYIVQAFSHVRASYVRQAIAASEAENLRPVPGGAWLVRATKAQYLTLLESGLFDRTRSYEDADKGIPTASSAEGGKGFGAGEARNPIYVVSLFKGSDGAAVRRSLSMIEGCEMLSGNESTIRVRATETAFHRICAIADVESVTEWLEPSFNNDIAVNAMHVSGVWPLAGKGNGLSDTAVAPSAQNTLGLTGKGQIVAVCDSGLDTGDLATLHPDVKGRVVKTFSYGRPEESWTDGDWSDSRILHCVDPVFQTEQWSTGHGTHVVGSAVGNGAASDGRIRGVAYEATLVFQSVMGAKGEAPLSGLGKRGYTDILDDAKTSEAKIHSNSWGGPSFGQYDVSSLSFDEFSFANPDFLTVVAAGNRGRDELKPLGRIDPQSIDSPGTAKNCITVGSCENFRKEWSEYAYSTNVFASPIGGDPVCGPPADHPGTRGMAASSSRGPCLDERIKPDVVAPGLYVLSTRSSKFEYEKDGLIEFDDNHSYCWKSGTSMATPLVAGTAALVRQWLVEKRGIRNPDASTIKAVIFAGAKSLAPGQYGTDRDTQEIPFTYPNNVEGWGMVNLENSVNNPDGVSVWDGVVISEKGIDEPIVFRVRAPGGKPLCILMAYTDYPGVADGGFLINDIDMTVSDPSGKPHYPNSLDHPDHVNNVEGVRWDKADAGEYVISVSVAPTSSFPTGGIREPMNPKLTREIKDAIRFSLVANGALEVK